MGIPPFFVRAALCNGPSCSTWSRASAVTSGFPTHCTTSISSEALCSFRVFRFLHCIRGFHCLDLDFVSTSMQQGPSRFTPLSSYRPLESTSGECSYVLAGTGSAILIQHNILSFLYTPEGTNTDLRAFGCLASAIQLLTGTWTQVDTPSVSSQQAGNDFFPRGES